MYSNSLLFFNLQAHNPLQHDMLGACRSAPLQRCMILTLHHQTPSFPLACMGSIPFWGEAEITLCLQAAGTFSMIPLLLNVFSLV